jgi:hypothetical protein
MRRLNLFLVIAIIVICGFAYPAHAQEQFPVGTVIAIQLDHTLDSRSSKPGRRIVAHIAQETPLEDKRVIRVGAKVFGEVTEVENALGHAELGLRFDRLVLGKTEVEIRTKMRALASALEVDSAKTSYIVGSDASNLGAQTTALIGGTEVVFRGGGEVENEHGEVVGRPVHGGVLAVVTNQAGSKCEEIPVSKTPQAVWLFSSRACGMYGFRTLQFENGTNGNAGEILLTRKNKKDWRMTNIELPAGSAFLLAISGEPRR